MALSRSNVGTFNSGQDPGSTDYVTGSFTPAAGSLLVAIIGEMVNAGDQTLPQPTCNGDGGALTHRGFAAGTASWPTRVSIFTKVVSGSSMTLTLNATNALVVTGWCVHVLAYTGFDSGTPIAGEVDSGAQATVGIGDGSETQTLSATPVSADEAICAIYGDVSTGTMAAVASGWTPAIYDNGVVNGNGTLTTLVRTGSTSTSVSVGDSYNAGGTFNKASMISLIVKAAAGGLPDRAGSGIAGG